MAYSMAQRCPHCGANNVVVGLYDRVAHPGSGDFVYDAPQVVCGVCGQAFLAVSSNEPLEGCRYPTGPRKSQAAD